MNQELVYVSGISGRFPKSDNVDQLWKNLLSGDDLVSPQESLKRYPRGFCQLPDAHGILNEIERFDASAFSIAPVQAKLMDPQARIILEAVSYTHLTLPTN